MTPEQCQEFASRMGFETQFVLWAIMATLVAAGIAVATMQWWVPWRPWEVPGGTKCRCECSTGGACEHRWDGEQVCVRYEDGGSLATTWCMKCGLLQIEHARPRADALAYASSKGQR